MKKAFLIVALVGFGSVLMSQKNSRKFTRQFYFDWASSELDSTELAKAIKFNKVLDKFELTKIEIIGHTDSDGKSKFNLELSRKRIRTVAKVLGGPSRDSLFVFTPKGEDEPIAANTDSTKHQNRRVTVIAYYSGKKGGKSPKKKVKSKPKEIPKKTPSNAQSKEININKEDLVTGNTIDLPWVRFHGGTDAFLPGAEETLGKIIPILKANPNVKIEIAGHICCGNDMALSVKRAKKVYDFLVINGVSSKNLTFVGYNNTQPRYGDIMDIRNRRVELRVL